MIIPSECLPFKHIFLTAQEGNFFIYLRLSLTTNIHAFHFFFLLKAIPNEWNIKKNHN